LHDITGFLGSIVALFLKTGYGRNGKDNQQKIIL